MFDKLKKILTNITSNKGSANTDPAQIPYHERLDGEAGIKQLGHREHIGGHWEEIGKLQFDFIVSQGLKPHHYFLDIACGSLRGGVHFIPYLEPSHYLGLDKEKMLIELGVEKELNETLVELKKPQFVVSADFDFSQFNHQPDFALAQSLFTHIPPEYIENCLTKLRASIAPGGVLFATFFETKVASKNPSQPHDWGYFAYTKQQMEEFGNNCGWKLEYIGNWNHPRNQIMLKYIPN